MSEGKVFINDLELPSDLVRALADMADQMGWVRFVSLPERVDEVGEPHAGYLEIDGKRIDLEGLI